MDQDTLVTEDLDAGAELVRRIAEDLPVKVAFWLKASDEEQHYLYLASDQMDGTNLREAYRTVLRVTAQIRKFSTKPRSKSSSFGERSRHESRTRTLDPFRVKVIGGDHPLARAAIEIQARSPSRTGSRFQGALFGGIVVDDVYIYPSLSPATVP